MYCCDSCCTLHICIFEPEKYLIVKGVKKMVMMMMMMMTQECGCMASSSMEAMTWLRKMECQLSRRKTSASNAKHVLGKNKGKKVRKA